MNVQIETTLTFSTPTDEALSLPVVGMNLEFADGETQEIKLLLRVDHSTYQRIVSEGLFNLNLGEVEQAAQQDFEPEQAINIEAQLDQDALLLLSVNATTEEEALTYFFEHNQENRYSPLYSTDSWFALHVTQKQALPSHMEGELKVGYATQWA